MEYHLNLARILASRSLNSLKDGDVLTWGPNPKGKFTVSSRYSKLDKEVYDSVGVSWWKQFWNGFTWPVYYFHLVSG